MSGAPRWVLLDRDGTINAKAPDGEYVTRPEELQLLPGAAQAVSRLNRESLPVALVTNQRGLALGRMSAADLEAVHRRLAELLAAHGAHIDAILVCPHEAGSCDCRKPLPGMLERAAALVGLSTADAVMIGDSDTDVEAGRRAGAATIKLGNEGKSHPDAVAASLADAVELVLASSPPPPSGSERRW